MTHDETPVTPPVSAETAEPVVVQKSFAELADFEESKEDQNNQIWEETVKKTKNELWNV